MKLSFVFMPLEIEKVHEIILCFQKLNAALPEINYSLAFQIEPIHVN